MLRLGGDDMALLVLIKMQDALYGDVIGFGGAGGKDDFFRRSVDQVRDLGPGRFDGLVGFPAVEVGAGVRVPVKGDIVREHGVQDAGVHGGGGLHIKVQRPSVDLDAFHGYSAGFLL